MVVEHDHIGIGHLCSIEVSLLHGLCLICIIPSVCFLSISLEGSQASYPSAIKRSLLTNRSSSLIYGQHTNRVIDD